MKRSAIKSFRIKIVLVVIFAVLAAIGYGGFSISKEKVAASGSGPSPSYTNAPHESNCTACHVDFPVNSGEGELKIDGLKKNYLPNQQIPMTITLNADAVKYGFQITAIDSHGDWVGTYDLPNTDPPPLQLVAGIVVNNTRRYVEHTSDGTTPTQFGTKSWSFTFNTPSRRVGKLRFYAAGNAANSDSSPAGDRIFTTSGSMLSGSAVANFDTDTKSDLSLFRPSDGTWHTANSSNGIYNAIQFGLPGDVMVPGDYDGDGVTDRAVWRQSNATWYFLTANGGFSFSTFGLPGDIPTPADYDGDLKTDLSVWRPSNQTWYILRSSNFQFDAIPFGLVGDKLVPADYDGDAKADLAVFRPSNSTWYLVRSTDSQLYQYQFGVTGDQPLQGDYDGDGRADLAVFRPSNSTWYFLTANSIFYFIPFGLNGDVPAPADFDGDGSTDIAVYRNGTWFYVGSENSAFYILDFGLSGDVPVARGYIPN